MTLLSAIPSLSDFNARMLRINYARTDQAMEVLAPSNGQPERVYTTKTTLPMIGRAVAIQHSKRSAEVDCGQTAKLTVSLQGELFRLAVGNIRRSSDNELVTFDSLSVIGRKALQPTFGGNLEGFAVRISPDGNHELLGLADGLDVELRGADVGHADDLAVACITILERRSNT